MSSVQTAYLIGQIVGGLLAGPISDKYGRKRVFILALLIGMVVAIGEPWIPNLFGFMAAEVLLGLFMGTISPTLFVLSKLDRYRPQGDDVTRACKFSIRRILALEYCTTSMRKFMTLYWNGYSLAFCVLAGIAFATRDWRTMQSIAASMGLALLPFLFL